MIACTKRHSITRSSSTRLGFRNKTNSYRAARQRGKNAQTLFVHAMEIFGPRMEIDHSSSQPRRNPVFVRLVLLRNVEGDHFGHCRNSHLWPVGVQQRSSFLHSSA